MKKKILTLGMVVALVAVLVVPMAALATNEGTQSASTTQATSISIRNIADNADVTTITFPAAAGGSVVSNPASNIPETQILTSVAADATPVAILTSAVAYTLWFTITDTSNWAETVVSESIFTQAIDATLDLTAFAAGDLAITVWDTNTSATPQALAAGVNKELYLQITLQNASGETGTSTLTVLGETP